jgi:sugar phosphate permease
VDDRAELADSPIPERASPVFRPWYRWAVFAVANLAFTVGVMFVSLSIITPDLMRDFGIQAQQMGLLFSAYTSTYALMQVPAGLLADRVGPRKVMAVFLVIGGVGTLVFSQAPGLSVGVAGRILTALGVSVLYVNQVKVLRGWFTAEEYATAMGIGGSINTAGSLIATPLIAAAVTHLGWRTTFAIAGGMNVLMAIICWIVIRDRNPALPVEEDAGSKKDGQTQSTLQTIWTALLNRQFILLFSIALLSYGGLLGFFGSWSIPFLMQGYGLSRMNAAYLMTGVSALSLISSPMWGRLSDKILQARKPVVSLGLAGAILSFLPLTFMAHQMNYVHVGLTMGLLVISTGALLVPYTMVNESVPASISGTAIAVLNMGPYIGGSIYQALAGFILGDAASFAADGTPIYAIADYQSAFLPSVIAGVLALVLSFLLKETMKKQVE